MVADIHGQFYDLVEIIKKVGDPLVNKYVFLGNYINRGQFSVEVLILIYSLKIQYKSNIQILWGKHETL